LCRHSSSGNQTLVILLFVAGCLLTAAIGVVFMALLLPMLVVLMIVGLWRPGALEDFFDWLGENNPVNVLMLLGPVHWVWLLAEKVDGRATEDIDAHLETAPGSDAGSDHVA
jgi:hypothetical protein